MGVLDLHLDVFVRDSGRKYRTTGKTWDCRCWESGVGVS